MDDARFDQIARAWKAGSRRRLLRTLLPGLLLAMVTGIPAAGARPERRRREAQRHRTRRGSNAESPLHPEKGCAAIDAPCAIDTACCSGICQRNGACTKNAKGKKKGKKKPLSGNCRCAASATIPSAPGGLQAVALDASRIQLTWNDVAGASGFRIHNGDGEVASVGAGVTSYTVTGLAPAAYRCHAVAALNAAGSSPWSPYACTSTLTGCTRSEQCPSSDICQTGICENGCRTTPISCRLRTFVLAPSDVTNLPNDAAIRARTDAALAELSLYYRAQAGLSLRYDPATVIRAPYDSQWFSQPISRDLPHPSGPRVPSPVEEPWASGGAAGRGPNQAAASLPGIDWGRVWSFMEQNGYGSCLPGLTTLVLTASSLSKGIGGGAVGGARCGSVLRRSANSGPDDGPGFSGLAMVGQWALDVVLTGEDSVTCKEETGSDGFYCPANVGMGTIAHELGHALGLPHPCDGWYAQNWGFTPAACSGLIMQSHWNYPSAGFSSFEQSILSLNPTLAP